MKKLALMTAITFSGLTALGATNVTIDTTSGHDETAPGITCNKDGKGVSCGETYWINVDTMTLAAANGDPIAQYAIAYITENGVDGSEKDPGLKKAADEGNPTACRALAHMYAHGKGVDQDEEKAHEFMEKCKEHSPKKDDDDKSSGDSEKDM